MADIINHDVAPPRARRLAAGLASTGTLSGIYFGALGLAFIVFGQDYRVGDLRSMGPGMFPIAGGWLLFFLGSLIVITSRDSERVEPVVWRPLIGVLSAVVAFALLVETIGLAIAGPVLIVGVLIATGQGTMRSAVILSVVLTTVSAIIFPTLLGVPLKVFP
jgi:Tripartite tricarboxylate transporter TctB family.